MPSRVGAKPLHETDSRTSVSWPPSTGTLHSAGWARFLWGTASCHRGLERHVSPPLVTCTASPGWCLPIWWSPVRLDEADPAPLRDQLGMASSAGWSVLARPSTTRGDYVNIPLPFRVAVKYDPFPVRRPSRRGAVCRKTSVDRVGTVGFAIRSRTGLSVWKRRRSLSVGRVLRSRSLRVEAISLSEFPPSLQPQPRHARCSCRRSRAGEPSGSRPDGP
jgi:hypothetical protein